MKVNIALIHYPVLNRKGEIITSAVTNLDIHDIARACRTYGVGSYFIVTPNKEQQDLVKELIGHWISGPGSRTNPDRKEALQLVTLADSLEDVKLKLDNPVVYATTATFTENCLDWMKLRKKIEIGEEDNILLAFGTASGLAKSVLMESNRTLCPISGPTSYNHLSVRSAVAIGLDRLLGKWRI